MQTLTDEKIIHKISQLNGDGVWFETHELREAIEDTDGEKVNKIFEHRTDSMGKTITEQSRLFQCSCGRVVHEENSYECPDCGVKYCYKHLPAFFTSKTDVEAYPYSTDFNRSPAINRVICRSCFWKVEVPLKIFRCLVLNPLKAIREGNV